LKLLMVGRKVNKLRNWPARFFRPAFFLLFLITACSTELPIEPEESLYSATGIKVSVSSINFDPTFIGRTSQRQVDIEYGDTLDMELLLSTSDSTVFSVSPDSVHFSKKKQNAAVTVTYKPRVPDSVNLGYLYLITYGWPDTLRILPDTLGVDSLRLAGVGRGYFLDMEMIFIPGGTFTMGQDSAAVGGEFKYHDEWDAHQVTLSDFFIGRYEVTNIQYYEFWKEDSTRHTPRDTSVIGRWPNVALDSPNFPVIGVSWNDAAAFCQWLSLRTGERYTLPTEAQWEYVATGGDSMNIYPWSSDTARANLSPAMLANTRLNGDGYTFTAPVDAFSAGASAFGPFNMAGNVWEWCLDWYDPEYYRQDMLWIDPQGSFDPENQLYKVIRGGSWLEDLDEARNTNRGALDPDNREINVGFRVVRLP